jgi:hypothetical protein
MHHSDISCPCDTHSVGYNNIFTGDAADHLAKVVLEHAAMTEFCGIPLASLRENSITELDLRGKGIGVPGAIVLSKLLPSAAALTSLKCACHPKVFAFLSMPIDTPPSHMAVWPSTSSATTINIATAPTSPRASPSCARRSREAP